jgi:stage II sporulation protein D
MHPEIKVGIMFAPQISFFLHGEYFFEEQERNISGVARLELGDGCFLVENDQRTPVQLPVTLRPVSDVSGFFELKNVTIGINFHWERQEDQSFRGGLKIIQENDHLTAINILPLEEYLRSVISSEMSATSSEELLKAHAVISRSWLLAQKEKEQQIKKSGNYTALAENEHERIRWYDREDHLNFDVCADDHCQRYQGITKASTGAVDKAIEETFGQVLVYDDAICDARYSKCCGGISEVFENVWEPVHHPYLAKVVDLDKNPTGYDVQLDSEEKASRWITGDPQAFCNTSDKHVLSQVLNDYDQETHDFYRWKVEYTQGQIRELLKTRVGIDVGEVRDLVPVERGVSGRLIKLSIEGTKKNMILGKELEIRKAFSRSHLYSSAFVIHKEDVQNGVPQRFILQGAGWGHGVGLCQIGAAVMGAKGYTYKQILEHYFKGAKLAKRY